MLPEPLARSLRDRSFACAQITLNIPRIDIFFVSRKEAKALVLLHRDSSTRNVLDILSRQNSAKRNHGGLGACPQKTAIASSFL
jgi:hypothetical protein